MSVLTDIATEQQQTIRQRLPTLIEHPLTWLAPAFVLLAVFRIYPLFEAVRLSFTNRSFLDPEYGYIGLDGYIAVLNSAAFWEMAGVTATFVAFSVAGQLVFGMILALAINHGVNEGLPGSIATRVSVLSAWVIPGIVIGILWKIILIETRYGIVNYALFEVTGDIMPFLSQSSMALASTIVANTWRGTAFSMILLFAGLRQVPSYLYDAAKIDGASPIQRFIYITLPQMKTIIFINIVLITIYTLNTFDMILALTGGGPGRATEVLALFMYFEGFSRYQLGGAATVAVLMLLLNIVMTIVYLKFFLDEEEF